MGSTSPDAAPLQELLSDIITRYRDERSGDVATYIPELGVADPEWFGVCLVTADGAVYEAGDSRQTFTIQSISKPFTYGMALEKLGPREVLSRVGVEPSGDAFNSISLQAGSGRPLNPMINAGAIAVSNMVYNAFESTPMHSLLEWFGRFAGRALEIDQKVYESESSTGHRNRAIAHLLRNFDVIKDPVEPALALYFRQCSILVNCRDLAVMGATLANHGINPVTGERGMSHRYVEDLLSVMTTCGMYNYAGQWLYEVGVPAKSGVSGGILAVLPGRMGIGVFSPRLDSQGNSVRGIKVCRELSQRFGLHLFSTPRSGRSVIRNEMTLENRTSSRVRATADAQRLKALGRGAYIVELQGDLHFSSIEIVQRRIWNKLAGLKILVLDFSRTDSVDAAGADSILLLVAKLTAQDRQVVCSGLPGEGRIREQLGNNFKHVPMVHDLDSALEACEESLLHDHPLGQNGRNALGPSDVSLTVAELDVAGELDAEELEYLGRMLGRHQLDPGHCICRRGDQGNAIFFLAKGIVSVRLYNNPDSPDAYLRLAAFAPGCVFGEIAAIDRGSRSADLWTETPAECFSLALDDFDRLGTERPGLKIKMLNYLLRILTTRLRRANDLIGQLAG